MERRRATPNTPATAASGTPATDGRARSLWFDPPSDDQDRRPQLTRERVVEEALAVIAHDGANALTMRSLATRLGVVPGALYNHVRNKQQLQDLVLDNVLAHPDVAVATDAIPYLREGRPVQGEVWPLPGDALAHPRLAGTFCRVLRQVRERRVLTLPEAIRRMTLVPAQVVEAAAPDARRKGRLQPGRDADVVAFDPDAVTETATYDDPREPSRGMRHVLVGGVPLVRDGRLDTTVLPGRPLRGHGR